MSDTAPEPEFTTVRAPAAFIHTTDGPVVAVEIRQPVGRVGGPWVTVGWLWADAGGADAGAGGFVPNAAAGEQGVQAELGYLQRLHDRFDTATALEAVQKITRRGGNGFTEAFGAPRQIDGGLGELRRHAGQPPGR